MVRMYSDWRGSNEKVIHEWIGEEEEAMIGEFMWIGEDTLI